MQASDRLLAQRYAKALFQASADTAEGPRIREELAEAMRKLRDHVKTFQHPLIPASEKKAALRRLLPAASGSLSRFLDILIERKRWNLLALVSQGFDRLDDEKQGVVRAQVRSAKALTDDERTKLSKGLEKFSGKKVHLDVKEDPALLGGVVVKMGDWVLDASLSRKLTKLRETVVGGESF